MGKTLGHGHQATGAFARIPLNPKVKEPRIFFAQIKSARLLIEEGLGEVEDLIKILIATRERLQILGKREIRRTVAVKPGALGCQPAIVWRTVVAHLRVNKGGEPWNLPKVKAKTVGRLGQCRQFRNTIIIEVGAPSPPQPRWKQIVAGVRDHGGTVPEIGFPLKGGQSVQERCGLLSKKVAAEGVAVICLDATPRAGNLFGPSEDVTGVERLVGAKFEFARKVKTRPRGRVPFSEANKAFLGRKKSIQWIDVVVCGTEPASLLQPSGHRTRISLVGVAINSGVEILNRIGKQVEATRFESKSSWCCSFTVHWRVEESNSCLRVFLTLAKGIAEVGVEA